MLVLAIFWDFIVWGKERCLYSFGHYGANALCDPAEPVGKGVPSSRLCGSFDGIPVLMRFSGDGVNDGIGNVGVRDDTLQVEQCRSWN